MYVAEAAEEVRVGGDAVPAPADERGADEVGGDLDADEDLGEEVVVAKHRRGRGSKGCLLRRRS